VDSRPSLCPECHGQRWFSYSNLGLGHPFYGRLFPCPACNHQAIDTACGLQDHEREITLQNIRSEPDTATRKMTIAAQRFIDRPYGFLSIHGNYGNGKTTTLMAIVNGVIKSGIEGRYLTAADLLAYLRETFNNETKESDYDRLHELAKIPVLCIDEMDKLRDTPYSREIQQELINLRYRNARILGTVLAWNGGINDLPFPAIASRVQEFTVISNSDRDLRPLLGGAK
jgi:chromosomal replication initiation ATPase DnaA